MPAQGSWEAWRMKSKFHKTTEQAEEAFRSTFDRLNVNGKGVPLAEMAKELHLAVRTIRDRVKKMDEFKLVKGNVCCAESTEYISDL